MPSSTISLSGTTTTADEGSIRPFRIDTPQGDIDDMQRRVAATRWPSHETVSDRTQGVQLATVRALADHWLTYDWRASEARMNSWPQFMTTIDGLDIHFVHVRSPHPNALPIVITHGWPGSFVEQLKIIELLTDPTKHGANASDAFDIVIPSLPGHGYSAKPTEPGWDPPRVAKVWLELMKRLDYGRYVAQGGDWGNAITEQMALLEPPELLGISTNMAATVPPEIAHALATGAPAADTLTVDEHRAWDQLDFFYKKGLGYANEMSLRPQTLYALEDSPVGLAAWMLDHDAASLDLIARVFAGEEAGLTKDDIVENISMYWLTKTAISSARLYWDNNNTAKAGFFDVKGVRIPVCVTVFPDEIYAAPQSWAERAYPNLIQYSRHPVGTHFAAWEQPQLLAQDLRDGFRSLR